MGAALIQREIDTEQPTQMDKLFKWIHVVRTKKMKWLRNRRRNIRVEAVLAHALCHAEKQLRDRQIARIQRWQKLREEMLLKEQVKENSSEYDEEQDKADNSGIPMCTELMSLDTFMSDLKKIKAPLQR